MRRELQVSIKGKDHGKIILDEEILFSRVNLILWVGEKCIYDFINLHNNL